MNKTIKSTYIEEDIDEEDIDVEQDLIDDFESINFGAKSLETVEQDLAQGNEELENDEDRKIKFLESNMKDLNRKSEDSLNKTIEKLNEKITPKLPHGDQFTQVATTRNK